MTNFQDFLPTSHRERDDDYRKVIAHFSPHWRAIICKDDIQIIVQKRSVLPPNTGTWAGQKYCMTQKGLTVACSRFGWLSQHNLEELFNKFRAYQFNTSNLER